MYYIAILDSGNYVFHLCRIMERKGYVFEVTNTPCQLAKEGCSYCLKFPPQFKELIEEEARANGMKIREIYSVTPGYAKNKYQPVR